MKRILLILTLLVMAILPSMAQDRSDRVGLGIGASYSFAGDAVLFWEHETRYHNTWEVFAEGQLLLPEQLSQTGHLWDNGKRWGVGAAYKPRIWMARNRYGSARLGVSLGVSPLDFQAALHAGWQHSYALRGGWQLYWQAGTSLTLPKWGSLFHVGACVGIKMPVHQKFHSKIK